MRHFPKRNTKIWKLAKLPTDIFEKHGNSKVIGCLSCPKHSEVNHRKLRNDYFYQKNYLGSAGQTFFQHLKQNTDTRAGSLASGCGGVGSSGGVGEGGKRVVGIPLLDYLEIKQFLVWVP